MDGLSEFDISRWQPPPPVVPKEWWRRVALSIGMLLGRSLFPILTVLIIAGTMWWGPWVTLGLAIVLLSVAARVV